METKPLLYGLIGFFIGGFIVSVAATTFDKPQALADDTASAEAMLLTTPSVQNKTGDAYDAAFIDEMIIHHEGAVAMARLSAKRAKHDEIKQLSRTIIAAQNKEIDQMRTWQQQWGYTATQSPDHGTHSNKVD